MIYGKIQLENVIKIIKVKTNY